MSSNRSRSIRWLRRGTAIAAFAAPLLRADGQMFAHRIMIPVPLDDSTRHVGLLPGFSYVADVQRGWHSAADDRAWDARLAGTIELWRVTRRSTIVIGTADELVANALRDSGFNPRGVSWELSIGAVHRFGAITAEVDFAHYCRHSIDTLDPPATADDPAYVPTQRTMSVNSAPRVRLIAPRVPIGRRIHVRGALGGERFISQWDGQALGGGQPPLHSPNSWRRSRGSASADLRIDADVAPHVSLFARGSGIAVFFAGSTAAVTATSSSVHANHRFELGWHAPGSAGALEVYGAVERLFDDMGSVVPRGSRVVGIGLRLAERNQF